MRCKQRLDLNRVSRGRLSVAAFADSNPKHLHRVVAEVVDNLYPDAILRGAGGDTPPFCASSGQPLRVAGFELCRSAGFFAERWLASLPECLDLIGEHVIHVKGIRAEKCCSTTEFLFFLIKAVDGVPLTFKMCHINIAFTEPTQHGFNDIPCLRFEVCAPDILRFHTAGTDMRRLALAPTQLDQLRHRLQKKVWKYEIIASKREIVPSGKILGLFSLVHLVQHVPPIADQPLCNAEHGNDDSIPQISVAAVDILSDNGSVHFNAKQRHRAARPDVRPTLDVSPFKIEPDTHDNPIQADLKTSAILVRSRRSLLCLIYRTLLAMPYAAACPCPRAPVLRLAKAAGRAFSEQRKAMTQFEIFTGIGWSTATHQVVDADGEFLREQAFVQSGEGLAAMAGWILEHA